MKPAGNSRKERDNPNRAWRFASALRAVDSGAGLPGSWTVHLVLRSGSPGLSKLKPGLPPAKGSSKDSVGEASSGIDLLPFQAIRMLPTGTIRPALLAGLIFQSQDEYQVSSSGFALSQVEPLELSYLFHITLDTCFIHLYYPLHSASFVISVCMDTHQNMRFAAPAVFRRGDVPERVCSALHFPQLFFW